MSEAEDAHPPLEPLPDLNVRDDRTLEQLREDGDLAAYVRREGLAFIAARLPKPSTRSLYTIGDDLLALEWLLLEAGGVLEPGEEEEIIDRWFSELQEERDKKLEGYAALIRMATVRAVDRKAEEDRILKLRRADEGMAARLKERLLDFMQRTGEQKIETTRFRIRVQANGGKLALDWRVGEDSYRDLPETLREERITYVPKQEEVRAALDAALVARRERMEVVRVEVANGAQRGDVFVAEVCENESRRGESRPSASSVRQWFRHRAPEDIYSQLHPSLRTVMDKLFPPSDVESILNFVDYKPRGVQVRIE